MTRLLAIVGLAVMVCPSTLAGQKASKFTTTSPPASIQGRVTVHQTVGRTFGEHPVPKLSLYLIRVEDGKALHELQRRCRKAVAQGQANPAAAYDVCMQSLSDAARMVPQIASAGQTQTDRDGNYKFENVPAGGRYQVVGVKYEGDEPVVIVGLSNKLKPGEDQKINLSENEAWTDAVPPLR